MIIARTVVVTDPLARANVVEAFNGAGAPAGVRSCVPAGDAVTVEFDAERTPAELIDALLTVELRFAPGPARRLELAEAIALAARGLNEPALGPARILETFLP